MIPFDNSLRGRQEASHHAHNVAHAGSNPAPATILKQGRFDLLWQKINAGTATQAEQEELIQIQRDYHKVRDAAIMAVVRFMQHPIAAACVPERERANQLCDQFKISGRELVEGAKDRLLSGDRAKDALG